MTPNGLIPFLATSGIGEIVILVVAGLATVGTAITAVSRRNPLHGAVFLIASFIGVAVLYFRLAAPFVGILQILIYAGAILVLYTFIIMLLDLTPSGDDQTADALASGESESLFRPGAFLLSFLLFLAIALPVVMASMNGFWGDLPAAGADFGTARDVGMTMFTDFALPFEIVGLLLLVAAIAAVVLAKREIADRAEDTQGMGRGLAS